jgi:hypothetical protein
MSDEVIDRLARIETKQDALMDAIEKVTYTVYGNGKPGILEEVAILKTKIEERTEEPGMSKKQAISLVGALSVITTAMAQWLLQSGVIK